MLCGVGAEVDDRQQANSAFRAERGRERSGAANVFANQSTAGLIQPQPAVFLGNAGADQSKIGSLLHQLACQLPILVFKFVDPRHDLRVNELPSCFRDHPMLFVEIFGGEDFVRSAIFDQKASAFENFFLFEYGCHAIPFCRGAPVCAPSLRQ